MYSETSPIGLSVTCRHFPIDDPLNVVVSRVSEGLLYRLVLPPRLYRYTNNISYMSKQRRDKWDSPVETHLSTWDMEAEGTHFKWMKDEFVIHAWYDPNNGKRNEIELKMLNQRTRTTIADGQIYTRLDFNPRPDAIAREIQQEISKFFHESRQDL